MPITTTCSNPATTDHPACAMTSALRNEQIATSELAYARSIKNGVSSQLQRLWGRQDSNLSS